MVVNGGWLSGGRCCVACSFWLVAVVGNVRSSLADDGWEPAGCAGAMRRGQLATGIWCSGEVMGLDLESLALRWFLSLWGRPGVRWTEGGIQWNISTCRQRGKPGKGKATGTRRERVVGGASAEHKETGELVHWFDPEEGTVWSPENGVDFPPHFYHHPH